MLLLGHLAKVQGLKGEFLLHAVMDEPEKLEAAQGLVLAPPSLDLEGHGPRDLPPQVRAASVRAFRWHQDRPCVALEGIPDRTAAETIVRAILWIDQDAVESPAEDDAWYDHQLVGLDVVRDGETVGRVVRVDHLPAQDLLIVRPLGDEDREILVPFVKAIVPEVDIAARHVVVTPPEGLFEELPADADEPEGRGDEPAEHAEQADAAEDGTETD